MDAKRWDRLKSISEKASSLDPTARSSFLDEACGNDSALREEVEALIAASLREDSFLERPPELEADVSTLDSLNPGERPEPRYERIGHYRVLHEIGRGGVGEVYLATRDDDEFRQRVAIKVLRQGMATDDVLRRFRNERQILASIDHPNVAKLLDGGTTEDGLPYFVLEYIVGTPIDEYCDSRRLDVEERLELFCSVCSAVHFAHQNLVVHRDLKPANILVNEDGTAKLLDFGIAKLLNPELSANTVEATRIGTRLLTPRYASPEQCRGESITTASDIYSLGVLLYELLTGHPPYQIASLEKMTEVITQVEPLVPSTVVRRVEGERTPARVAGERATTSEKLSRRLSGDLDNILLKTLRKEPHRRYGSVEQLSEEIRKHLAGLPVSATRDTLFYRAGKFVRRHRGAVAAAVSVLIALTAGLTIATVAMVRARRAESLAEMERDTAARESAKANAINDFLTNMLAAANPETAQGETVTVRQILDEAATRLESEDQLRSEPEVETTIRSTVGTTYMALGDYDEAARHLVRALEIARRSLGERHVETIAALNRLAGLYWREGRLEEGEELAREALKLSTETLGPQDAETLRSMSMVALLRLEQGALEEAEGLYLEVLDERVRTLGHEHPDTLETMNDLGTLYQNDGRTEEAEELLLQVLESTRRRLGDRHPRIPAHLNNLGLLYRDERRFGEAERFLVEALSLSRDILGDEHPDTLNSMNSLAALYRDMERYEEAKPLYENLLSVLQRDMPTFFGTAITLQGYGMCLFELGDYPGTERALLEAHRIFSGSPHPADRTVEALVDLYEAWGRPESARAWRGQLPDVNDP